MQKMQAAILISEIVIYHHKLNMLVVWSNTSPNGGMYPMETDCPTLTSVIPS